MPEAQEPAEAETPLHELFDRDPLDLSKQDLEAIVLGLRKQYRAFSVENIKSAGNNKKPKPKKVDPKKAEAASAVGELGDLL